MTKQIKITVSPIGDTKIDAEGFVGESCESATKALEIALAGGNTKKDHKPEFYESEGQRETQNLRF